MEISPERRRYAPSTVGTLRGFLLGLQGFTTVMHELLQNAEDAQATEFYVKFTPEALWVGNNAVFEDDHFQALSNPAAGSKRHDVEQIGSFGIGFTSVYQLTDSPQVMSRGQRHTLFPLEDTVEIAHDVEHEWATAIRLPWAFERTAVREALDSDPLRPEQLPGFIADARAALIRSAVFLKHIDRLLLADGSGVIEDILITRQAGRRTVATLAEQFTYRMYPVTVDDQTVHHLIEQGERQGQVMLAVPAESQEHFQGYFYASLPTQERTFLPFHLDANFYPHSDRKSLLWDGNDSSKQRWNLAVLRAARQALPAVLDDLRSSGAAPLYAFALACLSAPDQAGQSRAGPWVKDCAQTVRNTFRERPLLLSERAGWVVEERLTIPVQGLELAVDLQQRLESRTAWVFPPPDHIVAFMVLFQQLDLQVLSAERFISVLPALFKDTADLPAGVHAWEVVQPAVTYLRLALAQSAHPEKTIERHAEKLSGLPFAVSKAGDLTALKDVWHIESGWSDILETWCDQQLILAKEWAAEAGPCLLSLAEILTPDDLIDTLREWPHEDIQGKLRSRDVLHRVYEFLGSASFHKNNARELPICLGRDGQFYPANRVVLSGEIKDPFGCRIELDQEMEKKFRTFFASLGLDALDGDFYYTELLPDLARTSRDQREAILKHLAITRHLTPDRQAIWREVPMVQTIQGDWVEPSRASFEHPLLAQLFKSTYHAVARDLADNKEVKKFLKKLGVESTPTPEKLAAIVQERQNEPINEASLAWRGELVKHALKEPEVLKHLKDIAWLPSEAPTRWRPAQQLWHPERRILVGQEREADRDFIGLEMSLDDAQALGVSEPTVETVLRHLSALNDRRKQLPMEALAWLEHQTLDEEHTAKLQKLPFFLTTSDKYREPTYFFIGEHQLAPYRGVLSEKYSEVYPKLMKQLGVKQHPEAQDFAEVLREIATTLPDGGKVKPEVAQLVKFCLNECAKSWKPKEPEPTWMNRLRQLRVVPVGKKEDLRVLKPRDALRNDLPESELERYDLREAEAYFVHEVSNTGFLKALGIRGLREVMQVRLVSTADQGTPSSYTQLLRSLLPAILRYLHHLNEHKSPEKLQEEVLRWRFVTLKAIEAAISFPQFNFIRSRRVQLKHEIDFQT
ncbi:sacsin N-terminal ATP-binding-like domain-containing protein [Deinococcus sp.]|uniref:sacsin N-terminal ATP-binding-like domain-containing protein n=1 Tax=Deinococcus sp. TaxID=47478 RepID=UPI003B5A38D0